jgi:hypothetical protein
MLRLSGRLNARLVRCACSHGGDGEAVLALQVVVLDVEEGVGGRLHSAGKLTIRKIKLWIGNLRKSSAPL